MIMKKTTLHKAVLTLAALTIPLAVTARAGSGGAQPTARGSLPPAGSQPAFKLSANTLWYNGDFDGVNGLANENNDSLGAGEYSNIYDDFIVPAAAGQWNVTGVFSDNLENTNVTGATWEIRQGISDGNGGTLVAHGMTSTPNVTATGRSGFGFNEYEIEVTGLTTTLNPGTYFLNVTPIGDSETGRSFVSTTSGANAVGMPPGNDQNAYWNSNFFSEDFASCTEQGFPYDFSMGVEGTAGGGVFALSSTGSRKTDGGYGKFDVTLPGIEDRKGPANIVFNFSGGTVASVDSSSSTCGSITAMKISGSSVIVALDNSSCDQQNVTVTLTGVHDTSGDTVASASAQVGFLLGDVDGNGTVDKTDQNIVNSNLRQPVTNSNFRSDVLANGQINAMDRREVGHNLGHSL
jgi:hypothetical protein